MLQGQVLRLAADCCLPQHGVGLAIGERIMKFAGSENMLLIWHSTLAAAKQQLVEL